MIERLSIGSFIYTLQTDFTELASKLRALATQLLKTTEQQPKPTDEQQQLAENLNPDGAQAIATLLKYQQYDDLLDLQIAERMAQSYLQATRWVESIDVPTAAKKAYKDVLDARAKLRGDLAKIPNEEPDVLEALLKESGQIAQHDPVVAGDLLRHLQGARDIIRRWRAENLDRDDEVFSQLVENWQVALEHLAPPTNPTNGPASPKEIGTTLRIHDLLEEIYNLLAEDVRSAEPLNAAIL